MDTRIKIIAEDYTKDGVIALEKLSAVEKELINNTEQLKIANERTSNAQKKNIQEEIGIIESLRSTIKLLTQERDRSSDATKIQQYNKEIKFQTVELEKLTTVQKQSTVLTKEQNAQIQSLTGNTEKSNGMFKNLAATLLGLFAVDRIIDYSKQMFELVINSDRMNIVLKNVTKSNQEYHESLEFLNKLSNDYGQNVNTLKESYVSFLASSKSTNLSVKERQYIYESIIKAGSALTLSNDAIEGSLRAVSQMFSKGNVSAEELRGQLGERLPGAFGLLAQAMKVSEKDLNKMLEQGKVIAQDVLPLLAKTLNEAYGDKAKSNIDTVTGASNRFNTSLTENLTKINESTGFTKSLANGINFLADNFKSLVNVIIGAGAALAAYTLKQSASSAIGRIQLINLGQQVLAKQAASVATIELTAAETAAAAAATRFNTAVAAAPWGIALIALTAFVTMVMEHNDAVQRAYELTEEGIKATDEQIKGERAHAIELGLTIEQTKKLAYGTEERLSNVRKLMAQYPQYFKDMTEEQVSNWHLTNAYRGVNKEIERKITLLAREKSVQKNTERLADIKMELEGMGILVGTIQEYYEEEQKRGALFNLNNLKINSLFKEQETIYKNLEGASGRLFEAQKQMFNQEAQANKARLQAGLISVNEFKAEVMRIQEVYGIKVQNYKVEETLLGKSVDGNKKANKQKALSAEELAEYELKLKTDFDEKIKKVDDDYTKFLFDEYQDRKKIVDKAVNEIEKNIEKSIKERVGSHKNLEEQTKKFIIEIGNEINDFHEQNEKDKVILAAKTGEEIVKIEEKKAERINQINQSMFALSSMLLEQTVRGLDEKINKSTDLVEKAMLENKKAWASTGQEAIGFLEQLASGNVVGGVFSAFKVFFSAMNNTMNESTRIWEAEVAKLTEELKTGWDVLSGSLGSVKETYGGLVDDTATLKDLWEDDSIEGRINAEIKIGENINKNFTEATKNEDSLHTQKVSNINKELGDSIYAINKKYDYEFTKLNQKFDAESLAIQKGVNTDLMLFVTNQDLKLGLTTAYESKRAQIAETFALAYKPITEGMTETEINGINEAIKARDAAFAQLELWQTSQIQFVIDNGKLERDTFTNTQKIISDGKEAQYQLSLKLQAAEIALEVQKGAELIAAENTKNINIEIETQRHEGVITQLGLDRDAALEASFIRLRDVMTEGYSKMYDAAYNAYLQGKLTAEQFKEAANNLLYLMDLLQKGEVIPKKEDLDKYIEPIIIPRFNTGTEWVGGKQGIDKNLAWLGANEAVLQGDLNKKRLDKGINRFEMVEYAINYKSILDGGFQPLQIKTSALDKLQEHSAMQYLLNMNADQIVSELKDVKSALKGLPINNFNFDEDGFHKSVETRNNVTKFKAKRLK